MIIVTDSHGALLSGNRAPSIHVSRCAQVVLRDNVTIGRDDGQPPTASAPVAPSTFIASQLGAFVGSAFGTRD